MLSAFHTFRITRWRLTSSPPRFYIAGYGWTKPSRCLRLESLSLSLPGGRAHMGVKFQCLAVTGAEHGLLFRVECGAALAFG